jgi:hypothetical protein
MEATLSSETSAYNEPTRRQIQEDCIIHSHRRENLKSYTFCSSLTSFFQELLVYIQQEFSATSVRLFVLIIELSLSVLELRNQAAVRKFPQFMKLLMDGGEEES